MAAGIQMQYETMDQVCNELKSIVSEIITNKDNMQSKVEFLCETWNSAASERHRSEFATVGDNINKLTDMVEELITSIKNYRADMEQLDQSYS